MIRDISAVIIVKDAQRTIRTTLNSLRDFSEVILYDNGSTDKTHDIANEFPNVRFINGHFTGFGPTKNSATKQATNNWIFSLDADEVVSPELLQELKDLPLESNRGYQLLRINFYKKRQISHCWGDDRLLRIYDKRVTAFNQNKVHEEVMIKNLQLTKLSHALLHYPYSSISSFIRKLDHYSSEFASQHHGIKKSSPLLAIANASYSFFKTYFLKRGFLDGYPGLIIAFSHAATNFYKYIKLYELNKEVSKNSKSSI